MFDSYYGISLDGAEAGQKVRIAFRSNCQDKRSEEGQIRLVADILDNHAYPEVMGRIAKGSLTSDFRLHSVHLVMFRDSNRNEIFLNEDVKFMPNVKYKNSKVFRVNETVNFEDIEDILGLYPDSTNDYNSGHIMLTKFKDRWYYACDLIYELEVSKEFCERATTTINTADQNMESKNWILFLNNLLHICMLSTQANFILQYDKDFSLRQSHKRNIEYLTAWANNGNIDSRYSELYKKVFELRKDVKLGIVEKEAAELFLVTCNFVESIKNMLASLIYFRTPPLNYVKLTAGLQKKEIQKFKLISFGGIAAEYAADYDKTVKIRFQINCKDKFLENTKALMVFDILDNYGYPEAMKQIEGGILQPDFKLTDVHLVMYDDQMLNEILLNDKVRSVANIKYKQGQQDEKEDYLGLFPNESNDKNAAHVILTKLNDMWFCAYDLIYDRKKVESRFELAKSFFKVAAYCLQEKLFGPFVDNLYSATELSIQSILLLQHNPRFSLNQTHDDSRKLFFEHAELGNIDTEFSKHYTRLGELRDKGRYLNGTHGRRFTINDLDANKIQQLIKDLISYVGKLLEQVDFMKKPTQGMYIPLGRP